MARLIEITGTEIGTDFITITGTPLDDLLMAEDLFKECDIAPLTFQFEKSNLGNMKYLFKLCNSAKQTKKAKSMGAKIEMLAKASVITLISENFLIKE